jgi:hypothetical protein
MTNRTASLALAGLLLSLGLACGGSSSSPAVAAAVPAGGLAYTNPTGTGWRLEKDASSTSARLVLKLVGPAGTLTRGVGFNLKAPAGVKFDRFPSSNLPLEDAGVYELLSSAMDPNEPVAMTGGVKPGNILSAGLYQKGRDMGAKDSGTALCRIALIVDPAARPLQGTPLTLTVLKAKAIPEDIGATTDDAFTLDKKLKMTDLTVAVGTLTAN